MKVSKRRKRMGLTTKAVFSLASDDGERIDRMKFIGTVPAVAGIALITMS